MKLSFREILLKERKGKGKKEKNKNIKEKNKQTNTSYNDQHGSITVQELGGYQVASLKG